MKQIRKGVFETNSSSMHSITIGSIGLLETLPVTEEGNVELYGGEFGWGYERYNDAQSKASYCWLDNIKNHSRLEMLEKVIKDQTGCESVVFLGSEDYSGANWSYIDHQSLGTSEVVFEDEELLRQFIFNPAYGLIIDNDNH